MGRRFIDRSFAGGISTLAFALFSLLLVPSAIAASGSDRLANIHVIGVSSNLGEKAEIKRVGAMVFGNKLSYLPIADWRLDDLATSEAIKALSGRFTARAAPIDDGLIAKIRAGFFGGGHSLGDVVRSLPPSDVDAYLVLLPGEENLPYPSSQEISGLGVYNQWPGIGGPDLTHHFGEAVVHATFVAFLIDAKTGRLITYSIGKSSIVEKQSTLDMILAVPRPLRSPHAFTGDTDWPTTADALTDAQKQKLRDDLVGVIKESVANTLNQMGLQ